MHGNHSINAADIILIGTVIAALLWFSGVIDKLVFKCTEGASLIDVIGLCNGRAVKSTSVALESNYNVPTASYLKMLVKSSDLGNANFGDVKPAIESWIDGKHTSLR